MTQSDARYPLGHTHPSSREGPSLWGLEILPFHDITSFHLSLEKGPFGAPFLKNLYKKWHRFLAGTVPLLIDLLILFFCPVPESAVFGTGQVPKRLVFGAVFVCF